MPLFTKKKTRTPAKSECINPDRVPCDKARAYLDKKGLLCGSKKKATKKNKSIWDEWFG